MIATQDLRFPRRLISIAIAAAFCTAPPAALAAVGMPLGPEFRVPLTPAEVGAPQDGRVGSAPDGRSVSTWTAFSTDPDGTRSFNVFARVFAADGTPLAPEFQVNTRTAGYQQSSRVALAADGSFTIAWIDSNNDFTITNVRARRFAPDGSPRGDEFQIALAPAENGLSVVALYSLGIASTPDGASVIVWERARFASFVVAVLGFGGTWNTEFLARRLDRDGRLLGSEIWVGGRIGPTLAPIPVVATPVLSTGSTGPAVAIDDDGDFVVSWTTSTVAGVVGGYYNNLGATNLVSRSVLARRYSASGLPRDVLPIVVDNLTRRDFYDDAGFIAGDIRATVAMAPQGSFVLAWNRPGSAAAPGVNLVARRYTAQGRPDGPLIAVDSGFISGGASLAVARNGRFAIAWTIRAADPNSGLSSRDIHARFFAADGAALTGPITVNGSLDGEQGNPQLAVDASGNLIVDWTTILPAPGQPGLFMPDLLGRRFAGY